MADVLYEVTEIFENKIGDCVEQRVRLLNNIPGLGPPDLCQLIKVEQEQNLDASSFHYILGLSVESSASMAAYFYDLLNLQENPNSSTRNGKAEWKIRSGLYCCYNAFSKLDVRVEMKVPGSVETYALDQQGQIYTMSNDLWEETFVCSILRALNINPEEIEIIGLRVLDCLSTPKDEQKFLDLAKKMFIWGYKLSFLQPEPSGWIKRGPLNADSPLMKAILKYFRDTKRVEMAIEFFQDLKLDPEVIALQAEAYVLIDREVDAVHVLSTTLKENSQSKVLQLAQIRYLDDKGAYNLAVPLAERLVTLYPDDFDCWITLAGLHVGQGSVDKALIALNCIKAIPMTDSHSLILPSMILPARIHKARKRNSSKELYEVPIMDEQEPLSVGLVKLSGRLLTPSRQKAYSILAKMVHKVGWDTVLEFRSSVFLLRSDYLDDEKGVDVDENIKEDGSLRRSTIADSTSISLETLELDDDLHHIVLNHHPRISARPMDRPVSETQHLLAETRHKRICEAWLDELFFTLYEDMRAFASWKVKEEKCRKRNIDFARNRSEWELFGDLAYRLRHFDEACRAYSRASDVNRFTLRSIYRLVNFHFNSESTNYSNQIKDILHLCIKIIDHCEHENISIARYPSVLCPILLELTLRHGVANCRTVFQTLKPYPYHELVMNRFFQMAEQWQS